MATTIADVIAELTQRAKAGLNFADNMVLRALDFSQTRDKLQSLLDKNYTLTGAEPMPSGVETLSQVLFKLRPPPGTVALDELGMVVMFERSSNKFVSASDVVPIGGAKAGFGAVPFAMGAPSFVRATVRPTSDPANVRMQDRRADFWRNLQPAGQPIGERSGTPVGCWEEYTYGTSMSYDTNGQKDWHTVDDIGKRWAYDDITNDDPSPQAASRSGTPVGCWESYTYGTSESYDTNGTKDWHTVQDEAQKWVYDDIANDVREAGVSRGPGSRAAAEREPASGTPVGCWESYTYGTSESYDTSGHKDWHTVDDEGKRWVYDDISEDD